MPELHIVDYLGVSEAVHTAPLLCKKSNCVSRSAASLRPFGVMNRSCIAY